MIEAFKRAEKRARLRFMARRTVQLRVGGQTYRVVSSASDEEVMRLAAAVEAKLSPLMQPGRGVIREQAMLLAAMALAHDLEEERARTSVLKNTFRDACGRILMRVEQALEASAAGESTAGHQEPGDHLS